MVRLRLWFSCAAAALILLAGAGRAEAGPRRVLLLYSYEREFSHYTFASLFRPELTRSSPDPIEFIELSLGSVRATEPEPPSRLMARLRREIGSGPLDLVVPLGNPAAAFVQQCGDELFPDTPILLAAFDSRFVRPGTLPAKETAVAVTNDPYRMLTSILDLLPDTRTIMVVVGASGPERFWVDEVRRLAQPLAGRVSIVFTNEMTRAQLLHQAGALPPHSAILYGIYSMDAAGMPQMEVPTIEALHSAANAPMFGLHSHQLGHGIVGGSLLSLDEVSHETTTVALRLLKGESPSRIPVRTIVAGAPVFDARELRRWNIPERRLAAGSVVRYREPPLWAGHEGLLAAAATFVCAQTALVIGFAVTLFRGRRRDKLPGAGDPWDVSSAEAALARLTHRLMEAQEEERARLASTLHDDVCQQLAGLKIRLQTLELESGEGDDRMRARIERVCDQFSVLERRLIALTDPVYARLDMLGLVASARALCHRLCQDRGIALEFQAQDVPARVCPRITLAAFRVLQEAMGNAVRHAAPSRMAVTIAVRNGRLELDVDDHGSGFDPDAAIRAGAVGLVGMRERMRLVGGTWACVSRPGAGTRVHASVPL